MRGWRIEQKQWKKNVPDLVISIGGVICRKEKVDETDNRKPREEITLPQSDIPKKQPVESIE